MTNTWSTRFVAIDACRGVKATAVVIDVMRAFTTAAWAFERGVERIILTADLRDALEVKARHPGALALKDGEPQPGFELTNSPAAMSERTGLIGKTIVQCTTAGTVGAVAAKTARDLFCAAFVNARATAAAVSAAGSRDVTFVVTGSGGTAEEDQACAEYIAALLSGPETVPAPFLGTARLSRAAALLRQRVVAGEAGVDARDVEMCLEADRFDFAMRAREEMGLLTLRRSGC